MFSFLFKTGTYYMLWQKFRGQFLYLFISLVFIVLTFSIYDDVYDILRVSSKNSLWILMLVKYSILMLIILANIHHFKSIKVTTPSNTKKPKTVTKVKLDPIEEEMINKAVLKSRTDFILQKYMSKKDV